MVKVRMLQDEPETSFYAENVRKSLKYNGSMKEDLQASFKEFQLATSENMGVLQ